MKLPVLPCRGETGFVEMSLSRSDESESLALVILRAVLA